jgi:hypothetical protein
MTAAVWISCNPASSTASRRECRISRTPWGMDQSLSRLPAASGSAARYSAMKKGSPSVSVLRRRARLSDASPRSAAANPASSSYRGGVEAI